MLVSIRPTPAASRPSEGSPASGSAPVDPRRAALERNLTAVRATLAEAAAAAGRPVPTLVAVTKAVPEDVARTVLDLGCADLGENRAGPFVERAEAFAAAGLRPRWHFIGHLQRNKARRVLEHAHVLHSVDSERLADTVARLCAELGREVEVFVQVNLTGEEQKHGLAAEAAGPTIRRLAGTPEVRVRGIMAMGPLREHRSTRDVFTEARRLADDLERECGDALVDGRCALSMGMSGDAALATELGSDLVRIGSALYRELPEEGGADRAPDARASSDLEAEDR